MRSNTSQLYVPLTNQPTSCSRGSRYTIKYGGKIQSWHFHLIDLGGSGILSVIKAILKFNSSSSNIFFFTSEVKHCQNHSISKMTFITISAYVVLISVDELCLYFGELSSFTFCALQLALLCATHY